MGMDLGDFHEDWCKIVDKGMRDYSSLTSPERVWFNIQVLVSMAQNGGLCSYFVEGTVEHVLETMEDLRLLGANEMVCILEKMSSLFPNGRPCKEISDRMDVMTGWRGKHRKLLDILNKEFYQRDDELEKELVEYIIENKLSS